MMSRAWAVISRASGVIESSIGWLPPARVLQRVEQIRSKRMHEVRTVAAIEDSRKQNVVGPLSGRSSMGCESCELLLTHDGPSGSYVFQRSVVRFLLKCSDVCQGVRPVAIRTRKDHNPDVARSRT